MKKIVPIAAAVLLIAGFLLYLHFQEEQTYSKIDSYETCAGAGLPILDSYPPQCKVPNGKSFTQNIGNELELRDEILVSKPRPNQKVKSSSTVEGKARGSWFFEANFSGELFDDNNKSLGIVVLEATEEWMTQDFVSFSGKLEFATPATKKGKLIIKNANPSGMPENEKALTIPVNF